MDSDTESEGFYFESDHLPLRGNQDYSNVLRTIAMLEACKLRIHGQIRELEKASRMFVENPELLMTKLRNNEEIVPKCGDLRIPEIPALIGKYEYMHHKKSIVKDEPGEELDKPITVRGRAYDETKPDTFNKLWSCEEQRRLEELLIEYPPEQKEMRRYAKIAQALGNRTPLQVCSRVQKYFKKLSEAGMPIPGRKPKSYRSSYGKLKYLHKPSTFFPSFNVRVNMPEDEEFDAEELRSTHQNVDIKQEFSEPEPEPESSDDAATTRSQCSSSGNNENETKDTRTRQIIYMLEELRDEKEQCGESYQPDPMAPLCDSCEVSAATLKHWHCRTCHIYLRQCADCMISEIISDEFEHLMHDIIAED